MSELMHTELNCTTGEVIVRPYTAEEVAAREAMIALALEQEAERKAAEEATQAAKESAKLKLAALGLTVEEVAALSK